MRRSRRREPQQSSGLIDCAIDKGCNINVFAYEGAVYLPFALQEPHANAVHGRDVNEEDHPLPREWVAALMEKARRCGVFFRLGELRSLR